MSVLMSAPEVRRRVHEFYGSVADIFERWVARRSSSHTQRAYRGDVLAFVAFFGDRVPGGLVWPADSAKLLAATIADVQAWRDAMLAHACAPKTLSRRLAIRSARRAR